MTEVKTLRKQGNYLAKADNQLKILAQPITDFEPFAVKVNKHQSDFKPQALEILQINLGYMCNMTCNHCHVDAGPDRKEIMTKEVLEYCLLAIDASAIKTVDLTGGAPEMNPHFIWFVEELSNRNVHVIVRSNLTILVSNKKYSAYPDFFKKHNVEVVASLPCYTAENTDKQRGDAAFLKSIEALKVLNALGYGIEGTGLSLNLVYNPGGPSLPAPQESLEKDYKRELKSQFDLSFNHLYTITNLPISRFLDTLLDSKQYESYMMKLHDAFNPSTLGNVMCTNTLSVDWTGDLYDCDFNQMLQLKVASPIGNIAEFDLAELNKRKIVLGNHCFGCTAGAGSSCQGALN